MSSPPRIEGLRDLHLIGESGFPRVYRAREETFDRTVAVKVMNTVIADAETLRRFERECRALGQVDGHPNIVTVHSAGTTQDDHPYLIMAFEPGGSLQDRLDRGLRPEPRQLARIGAELSDALSTAHHADVLHRDVKPANVLLSSREVPKLADFGIARLVGDTTRTNSGTITASIAHAPPEQLDGHAASPASDAYSLGSTLAALAMGHPAYLRSPEDSLPTVLARLVTEPPPDLRHYGQSEEMADLVIALLQKSASARPADMAQVAAHLQRIAERSAGSGPATASVDFTRRPSGLGGSAGLRDSGGSAASGGSARIGGSAGSAGLRDSGGSAASGGSARIGGSAGSAASAGSARISGSAAAYLGMGGQFGATAVPESGDGPGGGQEAGVGLGHIGAVGQGSAPTSSASGPASRSGLVGSLVALVVILVLAVGGWVAVRAGGGTPQVAVTADVSVSRPTGGATGPEILPTLQTVPVPVPVPTPTVGSTTPAPNPNAQPLVPQSPQPEVAATGSADPAPTGASSDGPSVFADPGLLATALIEPGDLPGEGWEEQGEIIALDPADPRHPVATWDVCGQSLDASQYGAAAARALVRADTPPLAFTSFLVEVSAEPATILEDIAAHHQACDSYAHTAADGTVSTVDIISVEQVDFAPYGGVIVLEQTQGEDATYFTNYVVTDDVVIVVEADQRLSVDDITQQLAIMALNAQTLDIGPD